MAVTRIKNNQITDATITAAKIASQTLVGSLFATDLTLNSNLNIIGNLTITGTSSNINAINTLVSDPFIIFNNGYTGSLTNYTIGMLMNRNLSSLADFGSVNVAWVWSEADGAFVGIATTDTGTGIVSINNSGYANLKIGNISATHSISATNYNISSANVLDAVITTLNATNFSTGNAVISGGYISNLTNVTVATGNASSWYATTINSTNGNITTANSTTINAGTTTTAILNSTTGNITTLGVDTTTTVNLNVTTGNITTLSAGTTTSAILNSTTGNITTLSAGTTTTANLNSTNGNITTLTSDTTTVVNLNVTTGNITNLNAASTTSAILNATTGNITDLSVATTTSANVNTTNANITNGIAVTLVATNFSSGNAVLSGGSVNNSPIGNSTPSTAAFTTLTASGATTFTSSTQSDNASTGAVVVTGGLGVGANLNVAGNVTVTGNLLVLGNTTTLNTETLNVEDLNITVAANATSGAEANGAGLTVAGANATFTYLNADDSWNLNKKLNATRVGAANIDVTTANITTIGAVTTTTAILNSTSGNITNVDSTNINAAVTTSATLNSTNANITTIDAGTTTTAILNTSSANITSGAATTLVATNFSSGNAVIVGGSLNNTAIGNATPSTGQFTTLDTTGILRSGGNIVANSGVNASSFVTGALVVPNGGGVGITGSLYVQDQSTFQGNINAGNILLSGNINVSVGAVQSSFGVFFGNAGGIGALYAGTSTYTALPTTVLQMSGNVDTYAQVNFQNLSTGTSASTDYVATADNGDDNDGYINFGINSSTFNDPDYPGYYPNDGYLISHGIEPATGNLNIHSHNTGSVIKLIVGAFGDSNVRATVTNTGFRVNAATASTSTTTGALLVDGGIGARGNIHAAAINATPIGNTVPSTGSFTALTGTTASMTTLVATNFSTANAVITGGSMDGVEIGDITPTTGKFTTITATTIDAGTTTTATLNSTTGNITTLGAGTTTTAALNSTTGNITTLGAGTTTTAVLNSTTGNITTLGAGTTTTAILNSTTANITTLDAGTTTTATLNSTTGNITTLTSTTVNAGTTTTAVLNNTTANITSGAATTFAATNFSSANAQVAGGYADNFPVGANTAASGRFTTIVSTGTTVSAGNIVGNSGTASTSTSTGALVLSGTGGAGIGGNLNVGYGAIFNESKTANYDFIVRGDNDNTLIWARPSGTYDTVVIGNNATTSTLVTGAKLIVNTTDSMIIPTGTTSQRPGSTGGTDTAGMIRFNTSTDELEYYDGVQWNNTGTSFTIIAADTFDGDSLTTVFTLGAAATTNSCIISINGVVQIPTTAYSVSGTTLTFTSAPATGDKIDVRRLTTTGTITILQSDNGYVTAESLNTGFLISAGAASATPRYRFDTNGGIVTLNANTAVASANTATTVDSFATATYRSAKYVAQASTTGGKYQTSELLVIHDDTTAYLSEFGVVQTNGNVGTFITTISGGSVLVQFVGENANTNVRLTKNYTAI